VYYHHLNQFNLLFDYDAQINDTVKFTFKYREYSYINDHYKDTLLTARYRVERITTNDQNLKTFETKIFEEDEFRFGWGSRIFPFYYSYTEKLGYNTEFMPELDNMVRPSAEYFRRLRCYSDADFSFVSSWWSTISLPCDYAVETSINTPKEKEGLQIYPNPFQDHLSVLTNSEGFIEIRDITGKILTHSKISDGINEISTSHFLKGIYLAKIQNKDNGIQTFKMVKI